MKKNKIFLSYRRDDIPGYVGRLEDELERAFGEEGIFRDVEDIAGGRSWKQVIDQNLKASAAFILVIGPRWGEIWEARKDDPVNYVALELEQAKAAGATIIPVSIGGAKLPRDLDLGAVSWLREKQVYDISDKQGRWNSDVKGLIRLLGSIDGIDALNPNGIISQPATKKRSKLIWPFLAVAVLVFGLWQAIKGHDGSEFDAEFEPKKDVAVGNEKNHQPVEPRQQTTPTKRKPILAKRPPEKPIARPVAQDPVPPAMVQYPNISGTWISKKDGTTYYVEQLENGEFNIVSPGYANGRGRFIKNMPRKFEFTLDGVGYGEFSVSNSNQGTTSIGWIIENDSSQKHYDSLIKVD